MLGTFNKSWYCSRVAVRHCVRCDGQLIKLCTSCSGNFIDGVCELVHAGKLCRICNFKWSRHSEQHSLSGFINSVASCAAHQPFLDGSITWASGCWQWWQTKAINACFGAPSVHAGSVWHRIDQKCPVISHFLSHKAMPLEA